MMDAELVARFVAGDPGSVAEIYRAYGRLVYAVSYRVLRDAGPAQDATRRTFLEAWRLAAGVDSGQDFGRWLATIAGRIAIDMSRRGRTHDGNPGPAAATPPEPVSTAPSAEQIHDSWRARRAIDALPDQDRELIRLQHELKLDPPEIAARLGIPVASVRCRSDRAHHRLGRAWRVRSDTISACDGG